MHFGIRVWVPAAILACIGCIATALSAQQVTDAIQIISPAQGTMIAPGQGMTVVVTVTEPAAFSGIAVIGQNIGFSALETSAPFSFSLYIPAGTVGTKTLTAVGITTPGNGLFSHPISIDVEPSAPPTSLSVNTQTVMFDAIGEQFPLAIGGTFADGSTADLTQSSYVAYTSSNNPVATVDSTGTITAAGAGTASVTAAYTQAGQRLQTSVSITVSPPIVVASPASLSFGNQNVGTSSSAHTVTITNAASWPLNILNVTASPGFAETDNCTSGSPLAAGSSCAVEVTFIPTTIGAAIGALDIVSRAMSGPLVVSLTGNALGPAVGLSVESVVFGSQGVGTSSAPQAVTVTNTGSTPLTILSLSTSASFKEIDNCITSSPIPASGVCSIAITFTPTVGGITAGNLTITDNVAVSPQNVALVGNAFGIPSISLSAAHLTFAPQPTHITSAPKSVRLTNTGSAVLNISSISIDRANAGDFSQTNTCGDSVAVGAYCTINVTFTPAAAGRRTATLVIVDNNKGVADSAQAITLKGVGTGRHP